MVTSSVDVLIVTPHHCILISGHFDAMSVQNNRGLNVRIEKAWYNTLQLLGINADEIKNQHGVIIISSEMFRRPNRKCFEIVMFFLFSKLYPSRVTEVIREA